MNEARVLRLKVDIGKTIDGIDGCIDAFLLWKNVEKRKKAIFKEIWKLRCLELKEMAREMHEKYE